MTVEDAISSLYRIAVTEGSTTSTKRLSALAQHCVEGLIARGLTGAEA